MDNVLELQVELRRVSKLVKDFESDHAPFANGLNTELRGYGHSNLSLAVYKETEPVEFAQEQAAFMMFLGSDICPRVLSVNSHGYVMEYLQPAKIFVDSIWAQERSLEYSVWNRTLEDVPFAKQIGDDSWHSELYKTIDVITPMWAYEGERCLIHGDPTLDNTLITKKGHTRITDPIPPHRLMRPSIKAVDHGKLLQSFLGWEVVFRGIPQVEYMWPNFMQEYDSARRAVFWCMVALKRIALRNNTCNAGRWAQQIAKELEQCM